MKRFVPSPQTYPWISCEDMFKYYRIVDNYYYQQVNMKQVSFILFLSYILNYEFGISYTCKYLLQN